MAVAAAGRKKSDPYRCPPCFQRRNRLGRRRTSSDSECSPVPPRLPPSLSRSVHVSGLAKQMVTHSHPAAPAAAGCTKRGELRNSEEERRT